uniref:Cilia- and flagella-associated protein 97 n=1 Tax=Anopheles epiroticus TaxID=199890 RepID=A0A3F2YWI6_9DIPT
MNSHFFPGRTTPETMVGGIRKWEQLSRTVSKSSPLEPYGDGFDETHYEAEPHHPKDDSESDQERTPDDEYTEQHYSESEFHTEQEEDDSEQQQLQHQQRPQIQVSRRPPKHYEQANHLLHIDFISDELGRFDMVGSGQSRDSHPRHRQATTTPASGRKFPGQQHNISFSRERVREIERTNQILLRRIITTRPTLQTQQTSKPVVKRTSSTTASPVTSAANNRRKMQERIAAENEILLRKVNSVGSRLTKRMTS